MCLIRKRQPSKHKTVRKGALIQKQKKKKRREDYLIEDPSIRYEAHSRWEAEDIYDEDDFCDR